MLFIIYSSTYIKELIWLLFSVFSTKNLSSVVKMMMTVSKQRAGGGVLDTDDKQSLIDDIETGDWCLSPISCIYVALSKFFFNLRSPPQKKKEEGYNIAPTLPSICLIYTRLDVTNMILVHEKSFDKNFIWNCQICRNMKL